MKFFTRFPQIASISAFVRSHAAVVAIILVGFVGGVSYAVIASGNGTETVHTVSAGAFVQEVAVSGKVEAADSVAMSFEETGRISRVYVGVGDKVSTGDALAAIASESIAARLAAARAEEARRRVERANQQVNLAEVEAQQNTKVGNAYRTLLSSDLESVPQSDTYGVAAPSITGLYVGDVEGRYKFRIESVAGTKQYRLHTFDLENADEVRVSETAPTALGTKGLYVSFPDGLSQYADTTWYVNVPNVKSGSYAENFNAYQQALRERTRAIEEAKSQLAGRNEGTTIADAVLAGARAEVARLEAELKRYTLRAPFDGVVTSVDIEVGDTASQGISAVTVMSADDLEIESFVPEINISYLEVGDRAVVTLEAYGESVPFAARVVAIDPAETVRDGVSTYRVILHFDEEDERLKSGMTANIVITTDERENVISVPQGAVERKGGKVFVTVRSGEEDVRREVMTGPVSSLGMIEIISGLSVGEVIVLP